ncbi:MAG: DUF2339 domain-containing protein [Planctomycetaceae bacterium]|jgi:uncharacterized membrane protein|nr:DUF2339 domain-containing protein [Planctomycetaceae bacterium]
MDGLIGIYVIIGFIGLFFMGPIAFIWCCYLHSRIRELEEQKKHLELMLQRKLISPAKNTVTPPHVTEKSQTEETAETTETTKTSESVLTAISKVKEQIAKQNLLPNDDPATIADPALRTALQWAQAIPFKPVTQNEPPTDSPTFKSDKSEPDKPEPFHQTISPQPLSTSSPVSVTTATSTSDSTHSDSTPPIKKTQTEEEWEKIHPAITSKDGNIVWQSVELWIGRKLLGWVAVLGFIVSAALFIRHAVQSGWIGPELKVFGIAAFGAAFLVAGKYFWNNGWQRFSTMLSSAGIIILFQAGYASFAFYKLISVSTAGVVMSFIIFGSFLLAWHYRSTLLGIISILGGLAVPILLSTNTDSYVELFTYLIILNIGTIILVNLLQRTPIGFLAFFGTQIEFWLWYSRYYDTINAVPPEKLAAVLIFHGMFYFIYLADTTIAAMIPRIRALPTWDDAMRAIISPIIFFGTIWQLLRNDLTFGSWLGVTAFIGAAWYGLLTVLYSQHLARIWNTDIDRKLSVYWKAAPTAATVISLGFIAIGIPLHFDAAWLALGWVTVFAGLWYFGHRQDNKTFRVMAIIFIILGVCRLLYDIFEPVTSNHSVSLLTRLPIFSFFELPSLTAIFIAIIITIPTHRLLVANDKQSDIPSNFWIGLGSYGFMILFLSVELVQYFTFRPELYIPHNSWASIMLTLLWILSALLLLEIGFVFKSFTLQSVSILSFSVIIIKMLYDFFSRENFSEPIWNPFCAVIIFSSLILIAVGIQYRQNKELTDKRIEAGILGIAGIFLLLGVLSVECYQFFLHYPSLLPVPLEVKNVTINSIVALGTLSVLWTCYALVLFVLGISLQNKVLRSCALVVLFGALVKIIVAEMFRRPDYTIAFANPYFITMLVPVLTVMFIAVWMTRIKPAESKTEQDAFLFAGLSSVMLFWIFLSVECFVYFNKNPFSVDPAIQIFIATASLPVLWSLFGGMLIVIGTAWQSVWLRSFGLAVWAVTVTAIFSLIIFRRPPFDIPLLNPYFISVLIPATIMIIVAVWRIRLRPLKDQREQIGFLTFGVLGTVLLWLVSSVECFNYFNIRTDLPNYQFLATTSLTVFWTISAIIGAIIAGTFHSKLFRILTVGLILLTLLKVLPMEIWARPDYLTPFLNPFALPFCLLAVTTIFVCIYLISILEEKDITEQKVYQIIMFAGVVFLWLVLSLECFKVVRLLQGAENEAWKAQMSLSILWSVFAGVLIFIGFVWRSPVLRWMAILLFAVTLTKILIVDMAGVHEIYRFGAVFVLAIFLSLAAWAYQRFKPEPK